MNSEFGSPVHSGNGSPGGKAAKQLRLGGPKQRALRTQEEQAQNLQKERSIRKGLKLKMQKAEDDDNMKPLRSKGGKVLYRSIEKPLKLYAHGMRVVDITNPDVQKEMKNRYVLNTN